MSEIESGKYAQVLARWNMQDYAIDKCELNATKVLPSTDTTRESHPDSDAPLPVFECDSAWSLLPNPP